MGHLEIRLDIVYGHVRFQGAVSTNMHSLWTGKISK